MNRRTFLKGSLSAAAAAVVAACGRSGVAARQRIPRATSDRRATRTIDGLPVASWVVEENARPGTYAWVIPPSIPDVYPAPIEGYLDKVSAQRGDELTLYVRSTAPHFRAEVYRMGYYGGRGARLVHVTPVLDALDQPEPSFTSGTNMIECHWRASRTLGVDEDWLPGNYLIKLASSSGAQRYVPFTVRDDSSRSAFLVQNSVTTWQAYNLWGGYSLYGGTPLPGLSEYDSRSRVVSFDRPYHNPDAHGSGDWLGNEFPFIFLAERHGLDVSYWTDVDLHEQAHRLAQHKVLVSLGHDEYWSSPMRFSTMSALREGLNVAFFGANACYRQIRFEPSPTGADRRVICYKDAAEDPITATEPALSTAISWAEGPDPRPESELIGLMYQSYGASGPHVVVDAPDWVFKGSGLSIGGRIEHILGSEFDGFEAGLPGPRNVQLLCHSPTNSVSGASYSDMSYYTVESGGGVFATGTADWVTALWDGDRAIEDRLDFGVHEDVGAITAVTLNVLSEFAKGPAARARPSRANWQRFYSSSEPVNLGTDVSGYPS